MPSEGFNPFDYTGNMFASPFVGLAETISQTPIPGLNTLAQSFVDTDFAQDNLEWQQEHPLGNFIGQVGGFILPGMAFVRAARGSRALIGAAQKAANLGGRNPFLRRALSNTVFWSPFMAATTALDALGDRYEGPGEAVASFAIGSAFGGSLDAVGMALDRSVARAAVGSSLAKKIEPVTKALFRPTITEEALFSLGSAARDAANVDQYANIFNPYNLAQLRLRELDNPELNIPPEVKLRAEAEFERDVVNEERPAGVSHVNFDIATVLRPVRRYVESTFRSGVKRWGEVFKVAIDGDGRNSLSWIMKQLGISTKPLKFMQFPRILEFNTEASGGYYEKISGLKINSELNKRARLLLQQLEENKFREWGIQQEREGLFIMSTRLGDKRYLQFKTDRPEEFLGGVDQWNKLLNDPAVGLVAEPIHSRAWRAGLAEANPEAPELYKQARALTDAIINPENMEVLSRSPGARQRLADRVLGRNNPPGISEVVSRVVKRYLSPPGPQFRHVPEAGLVFNVYRALSDVGQIWARRIVEGAQELNSEKDILGGLFGSMNKLSGGLRAELTRLIDTQERFEQMITHGMRKGTPLDQIADTQVREAVGLLRQTNRDFVVNEYNPTMREIGQDGLMINLRAEHLGVSYSHRKRGSNHYTVLDEDGELVGLGSGSSAIAAKADAEKLIELIGKEEAASGAVIRRLRLGEHYTDRTITSMPKKQKVKLSNPAYLETREGVRGYEYDVTTDLGSNLNKLDEFISNLETNYLWRTRTAMGNLAHELTKQHKDKLRFTHPDVMGQLNTRITQLFEGDNQTPFAQFQNLIFDTAFEPFFGTNGASKLVEGLNRYNGVMTLGMGNVAYVMMNGLQPLQNTLPEVFALLRMSSDELAQWGYLLPVAGKDGKPNGQMWTVANASKIMSEAFSILKNPDKHFTPGFVREVFNKLEQINALGFRQMEEYSGENRRIISRVSDAVKGPGDFLRWMEALSNWAPSNMEKFTRAYSAAASLGLLKIIGKAKGVEITPELALRWADNFLARTAYRYTPADRPQIFTSPAGTLLGQFKNWYVNYIHQWADYTGLLSKGNFLPLLTMAAVPGAIGGVLTVPLLIQGMDWATETFADKDALEWMYSEMGAGATPVAFGITGMLGLGMTGSIAAPGSNFNHDLNFMFSLAAIERMKAMGRAVGTLWDESMVLGQNPLDNPILVQQMLQGFGPRSLYRAYDALVDGNLNAPSTGQIRVANLSVAEKMLETLGFRGTDATRQYEIFDRMMQDKEVMQEQVSMLGEAYYRSSAAGDRDMMEDVIRVAAARGVDISAVMRSAQRRARDAGTDMFGRGFSPEILERYEESLAADQ